MRVGAWSAAGVPLALLPEPFPWATPAACGVIAVALVAGRRYPLITALVVLAVSAADWRLLPAVMILFWQAGLRAPAPGPGDRRAPAVAAGFALAVVAGVRIVVSQGAGPYTWLLWIVVVVVCGVAPMLAGGYQRLRGELEQSGWDRADRLERERHLVSARARAAERARIAREMHDSLGHELSLIALHAGALELAADLDPRQRAAASEVRAGVSTAAERLAEIVGLLWAEDPERRVEDLIVRAADAGVAVTLSIEDEPGDYEAAYVVVREALTNAAKHAPGAPVEVLLRRDSVVVRNAPPPARTAPASGAGSGLAGLRERVGGLRAGPAPDGGFEVVAHLSGHAGPPGRPGPTEAGEPPRGNPATALRHRTGRGRTLAVGAPAALVLAVVGTLMALYAYDSGTSRLAPAQFRALPLGAARVDLAGLLPARQVPERRERAGPAGTDCEYYRSSAGPVPRPFDVYRLCFRDGSLVAKDVLPPE